MIALQRASLTAGSLIRCSRCTSSSLAISVSRGTFEHRARFFRASSASSDLPSTTTPPEEPMKAAAPSNGAESKKDDVSGAMLEPSVVNTSWVRSLATIGAVCLAAASTGSMPAKWAALVHVLAFGTWLGTMFWNTFFVGITMFKLVPRQMFGRVQSVLFPRYFALTTGANILLLGSLLMVPAGLAARISAQAVPVLSVALVASVINWLGVEPIATKLMFQRYDLENLTEKNDEVKDKIKVLYKEFGKWHGISSLLNLVIFCCALAHAWYLGAILAL